MEKIYALIKLFFPKYDVNDVNDVKQSSENFTILHREARYKKLEIPDLDTLLGYLESFSKRDTISFFVEKGDHFLGSLIWKNGSESNLEKDKKNSVSKFIEDIKNHLPQEDGGHESISEMKKEEGEEEEEESGFCIKIKIEKTIDRMKEDNRISIYSFKHVINYLTDLTLEKLYFVFNEIFGYRGYIAFVLQEENVELVPFYTSTFYFIKEDTEVRFTYISQQERDDVCDKRNKAANFLNAAKYPFIPQDFFLQKRSNDEQICQVMDRLSLICTLTYLCDLSSFQNNNEFSCQLTGYRTIKQTLDFKKLKISSCQEYLKIYKWVYFEGNLTDKIGLARNIISISIDNNGFSRLPPGTFDSIKSSHQIYLKENVEKYFEVINRVSESVLDMCQKASEIVNSFTGTFKNNVTAFISYFISLIISNSIVGSKFENIFTTEITVLSFAFLLVSLGFFCVSIKDTNKKKVRFFKTFLRLKNRYKFILDKKDLDIIIKRSFDIKAEMNQIKLQVKNYGHLWLGIIIIFSLVIFYFGVLKKIV